MFPLVQTRLLSLVVGVLIVKTSEAYPDGAPVEACRTFRPGHGPHSYDASAGSDPSKLYNITTRLSGHGYEGIKHFAFNINLPYLNSLNFSDSESKTW